MNAWVEGVNGMGDMNGMGGGMGGMMIWMLIWGLVGLALLVLVVVGVVWLVRRTGGADPVNRRETPEEVLRRRYAAGELDEDEYLHRRAGLKE